MTYEDFKERWNKETTPSVKKELKSWRAYIDKHSSSYSWHGKGITPPGSISDGDKVSALKEILSDRGESND